MKPYYAHAGITIYHGDCREILPQLESVDLVLTDPPYGMAEHLTKVGENSASRWRKHFSEKLHWDVSTVDEAIPLLMELAKDAIIWGGQFYALPRMRGWLIWNKIIRNWSASECELAWTTLDQPNRAFDYSHGELASEGKHFHPTQKPLPLMKWCIQQARYDDLPLMILDPFMGSGTTLRAAKDLGRRAIGVEIEEKYCEIAAKRLSQEVFEFSGQNLTQQEKANER